MKKLIAIIFAISLIAPSPAQANLTRCKDGTYSSSTGRGTCSRHGGVAVSQVQIYAIEANLKRQKEIARIAKEKAAIEKSIKEKADAAARAAGYANAEAKNQAEKIAEDKRIAAEKAEQQRIATELEIQRIRAEAEAEVLRIQNAKILEDKLQAEKNAAQAKIQAAVYADMMAKQEKQLNPNNSRQYVMQTHNFTLCDQFGGIYNRGLGKDCSGFVICEQHLVNKGYAIEKTFNGPMRNDIELWVSQGRLIQTPDNPSCALIKGTLNPGR